MSFIFSVLKAAWNVSPVRNLLILLAVAVASISTILAPYYLGKGVVGLIEVGNTQAFYSAVAVLAVSYSALWFIGNATKSLIFPLWISGTKIAVKCNGTVTFFQYYCQARSTAKT